MNPRYEAYLKTTDSPKNWEFMAFIDKMENLYGIDREIVIDSIGYYQISDHDDFTAFIERRVNELQETE